MPKQARKVQYTRMKKRFVWQQLARAAGSLLVFVLVVWGLQLFFEEELAFFQSWLQKFSLWWLVGIFFASGHEPLYARDLCLCFKATGV